jgi:hypothetical protein
MVFRLAYALTNLLIAIVFGTKGRHPSIDEELRPWAWHTPVVLACDYHPPETPVMTTFHVILRKVNDSDGSRLLRASLNSMGDVIIEGRDYGAGVERIFGVREYEWAWTIPAASVPALLHALEATSDVLSAISRRFSGDHAADLGSFLEANGISAERWSRLGD